MQVVHVGLLVYTEDFKLASWSALNHDHTLYVSSAISAHGWLHFKLLTYANQPEILHSIS